MVQLYLFGSFRILKDGQLVQNKLSLKAQALLCYLVVTKRPISRHALAGMLWGDVSEEKAKNSLRVALSMVRKLFPDLLDIGRQRLAVAPEAIYWLDADRFSKALLADPQAKADGWKETAALYEADFLTDFHMEKAIQFEEWLMNERAFWQQKALGWFKLLGKRLLQARQFSDAVLVLQKQLKIEPWEEASHRELMHLYARMGQFEQALKQYQRCQTSLQRELDLSPMPETTALYERVLAARQAIPPLLPMTDGRFVGRQRELHQLVDMLLDPAQRLVTIVGFGGIGKTRLAIAAAEQVNRELSVTFLNGVLFAPLANISNPDDLPFLLAELLGVLLNSQRNPDDQLIAALHNREMLLIMDNFEQLMAASPLLLKLMTHCPHIKLLVTSREPLYLSMESRLNLEGLSFPKDEYAADFLAYDALQYFEQSAQQRQPEFTLTPKNAPEVIRLSRVLAGSPLALRLAAQWLRTIPLSQLLAEVRGDIDLLTSREPHIPERQRSMRVIFDYTYTRLSAAEQRVLHQVAIFRGGFTLTAAREVTNSSLPALMGLVERFLLQSDVQRGNGRYVLHPLTRQYAVEKQNPVEITELGRDHATYFARYAHQQRHRLYQREHVEAMVKLVAEDRNLLAAWQWLLGNSTPPLLDEGKLAQLLDQILYPFATLYHSKTRFRLGEQLLRRMIEAVKPLGWKTADSARQKLYAQLLIRASLFSLQLAHYSWAETQLQEAILLLKEPKDARELSEAWQILGQLWRMRGRREETRQAAARAIQLAELANYSTGKAVAFNLHAVLASDEGKYEQSRYYLNEAIQIYERDGYIEGAARMTCNLGSSYARALDVDKAQPYYEQSLAMAEVVQSPIIVMVNVSNLAHVMRVKGKYDEAKQLYQQSLQLAREMGIERWIAANLMGLGHTYQSARQFPEAVTTLRGCIEVGQRSQNFPDALGGMSLLGMTWAQQGKVVPALRLMAFVEQHQATLARDKANHAELLNELLEELPPQLVEEMQAWGANHDIEDVVRWLEEELVAPS